MIGNQTLTESDMWERHRSTCCCAVFSSKRCAIRASLPPVKTVPAVPGSLGGMNWGSVSLDPNNSLMFVNDMRLGTANYMVPRAKVAKDASGSRWASCRWKARRLARCANVSCRRWAFRARSRRSAPCPRWI